MATEDLKDNNIISSYAQKTVSSRTATYYRISHKLMNINAINFFKYRARARILSTPNLTTELVYGPARVQTQGGKRLVLTVVPSYSPRVEFPPVASSRPPPHEANNKHRYHDLPNVDVPNHCEHTNSPADLVWTDPSSQVMK